MRVRHKKERRDTLKESACGECRYERPADRAVGAESAGADVLGKASSSSSCCPACYLSDAARSCDVLMACQASLSLPSLASANTLTSHFTPTSASWIDQVERRFAELAKKQIQRGLHTSVRLLEADRSSINPHPEQGFRVCLGVIRLADPLGRRGSVRPPCGRSRSARAPTVPSNRSSPTISIGVLHPSASADDAPILHADIHGPRY